MKAVQQFDNRIGCGSVVSRLLAAVLFTSFFSTATYAACEDWIARVVSVQGSVDVRESGSQAWQPVKLQQAYCQGDVIRVNKASRAALELHNDTIIRLNQNSTLALSGPKDKASWLDLLKGSLHSITRVPRSLEIKTPFVNAAVEGTEFQVSVMSDHTLVGVIEGLVAVSNEYGSIKLAQAQSAITYKGKAPVLRLDINPSDSVQWSLYYPRLDVSGLTQAEELLVAGDVKGASEILANQKSTDALSLKSIIAIAVNNKEQALTLADQAVQADGNSATAHIARSYALQTGFDLPAALQAAKNAITHNNQHTMAWARLAELHLSLGELDEGLAAAKQAVALDPKLARTQTLLGFAHLLQYEIGKAKKAFKRSIELDSSDPLARLGNGLAIIRDGDLKQGRREIEIAASLDTNNSLIRSYLGKAYYEEKRNKLAADQFALAKQMDPNDPTPWLYDAIRKQGENDPVGALKDVQKSVALNNNRSVYRSRFMLDDDLASKGANLGRIYHDLGFDQLASREASRSLSRSASNSSAHRLLSDGYLSRTRHEVARVSELLQSQMLQEVNVNPVQPQLGESSLNLLNTLGASSLHEYDSLFMRSQHHLILNGVVGGNDTNGEEAIFSGLYNNFSFSLGHYRYTTDGYNSNNGLTQKLFNLFLQTALTANTSVLFEVRNDDNSHGDILRFNEGNFSNNFTATNDIDRRRIGFHHKFNNNSRLLLTAMSDKRNESEVDQRLVFGFPFATSNRAIYDSHAVEIRYIQDDEHIGYTIGYGRTNSNEELSLQLGPFPPQEFSTDIKDKNAYLYLYLHDIPNGVLTLGASVDSYNRLGSFSIRELNPKLGFEYDFSDKTQVRLAYFETLRRSLLNNQTLEPTTVSGFNQFFDDTVGTKTENIGLGLDHKLSNNLTMGVEYLKRDQDVPFIDNTVMPPVNDVTKWREEQTELYAYWLPRKDMSITFGLSRLEFERDAKISNNLKILDTTIDQLPISINWFASSRLTNRFKLTYAKQQGEFVDITTSAVTPGEDKFWVFDWSLEYKFPANKGAVALGVKNLFDEKFNYQDADINRQTLSPERLAFMQLNLFF